VTSVIFMARPWRRWLRASPASGLIAGVQALSAHSCKTSETNFSFLNKPCLRIRFWRSDSSVRSLRFMGCKKMQEPGSATRQGPRACIVLGCSRFMRCKKLTRALGLVSAINPTSPIPPTLFKGGLRLAVVRTIFREPFCLKQ
jgi:hypothetical protein